MKFTCSRDDLFNALQIVSSVAPSRPVRPILEGVRVVANPEKRELELTATDLDVAITCRVPASMIEEAGSTVLPASRLAGLVRELEPEHPVTVSADLQSCTIVSGRGRFKLVTADPAEFPELPKFDDAAAISLPESKIRAVAPKTVFATARERSQYALNGVLLAIHDDSFDAVGSDGRRLALFRQGIDNPSGFAFRAIVPPSAITLFERTLGAEAPLAGKGEGAEPEERRIEIRSTDSHVAFRSGRAEVSARLVEGEYPDYEQVIPPKGTISATIRVDKFTRALRAAGQMTSAHTQTVKLEFTSEATGLVIRSQTPELGEATIEVDALVQGGDVSIGFNPEFILDALKIVRDGEVLMEFSGPDRAGVLSAGKSFQYVVMPMSLD
jgi:DNA polymerase-3 subunit beta